MGTRTESPDHRSTATAGGRSMRAGARLTSTVVAATTLAAVLASLMQASAGQALGRAARGDAVAAVALAMAREMMATRQVEAPASAPLGSADLGRVSHLGPMPTDRVVGMTRRLGPHRLDLPPPAA